MLLRAFAEAWAEAAVCSPSVALADPFAGADYPRGVPLLSGAAANLSEALGVRLLLAEEDPAKLAWLARAVSGALAGAELLEGLPAELESLSAGVEGAGRALLVLDAPEAGKLPLELVLRWVAAPGADLAIRFPAADLRRLARSRGVALADLSPHLKRTVQGVCDFLGDARHDWLHAWTRSLEHGLEEAIGAIAEDYARGLRGDRGLLVREVALPGRSGVERFLLATHSGETSLLLNRVLHAMRTGGLLPWPEDGALVRYRVPQELGLFPMEGPVVRERVVDRALVASTLERRFAGGTVSVEDLLRSQGESGLFAEEVMRAVRELRRQGRVRFRESAGGSEVEFCEPGARHVHRRSSRRPRVLGGELALALEGE